TAALTIAPSSPRTPTRPYPRPTCARPRRPWTSTPPASADPAMRRVACCLLILLVPAAAWPQAVYRWTAPDGTPHYGDRADLQGAAERVVEVPVQVEPSAVARLRIEPSADGALAWIDNLLAGPV